MQLYQPKKTPHLKTTSRFVFSRPKYLCIPQISETENPLLSEKVSNGGPLVTFSEKNGFSISVFLSIRTYFDLLNTNHGDIFRSGDFLS